MGAPTECFVTTTMPKLRRRLLAKECQSCPLVQGDVIRLVALDFILGAVLIRMVDITFVRHILSVHLHNPSADMPGFGVPGHAIADFECACHGSIPWDQEATGTSSPQCARRGRSELSPRAANEGGFLLVLMILRELSTTDPQLATTTGERNGFAVRQNSWLE